jgi:hypothetical protein
LRQPVTRPLQSLELGAGDLRVGLPGHAVVIQEALAGIDGAGDADDAVVGRSVPSAQ